MVSSSAGVTNFQEQLGSVVVGGGGVLRSVGVGDIHGSVAGPDGKHVAVELRDVLVVPGLGRNLLSVRKVEDLGGRVVFGGDRTQIEAGGAVVPVQRVGGLYELTLHPREAAAGARGFAAPVGAAGSDQGVQTAYHLVAADLWHRRLGHRNMADIKRLGALDVGVPAGLGADGACDICQAGKHSHASFSTPVVERAAERLGLVHTDLCGPMEVESVGRSRYAICFTDDKTRFRWVYFLKQKSDAAGALESLLEDAAKPEGIRLRAVRSDGGGEFAGDFAAVCRRAGVKQQLSAPYAPQQNGVAERTWGVIIGMARCLLADAGLPKVYWPEAVRHAVYLVNRLPTAALDGDTPYHAWHGKHARLDHLRVFGARAWVQLEDRRKLDDKAWRGVLVGCEDNRRCYRILDLGSRQVFRTAHVTFDEGPPSAVGAEAGVAPGAAPDAGTNPGVADPVEAGGPELGQPDATGMRPAAQIPPADGNETSGAGVDAGGAGAGAPRAKGTAGTGARAVRQSTRAPAPRECQDWTCPRPRPHAAHAALPAVAVGLEYALTAAEGVATPEPTTLAGALGSAEREQWVVAMQEEYSSLVKTGTWELVELPAGASVVGSKWVYKRKLGADGAVVRYKARLVAKGFTQVAGRDYFETYAPVARWTSIRTILALAAAEDWELQQMDVETAYLNAPVEEAIYLQQPPGLEQQGPGGQVLVCRLHKSLYGLKQAARNWNSVIHGWLEDYGLRSSAADPCVYVNLEPETVGVTGEATGGVQLVVAIYVDDLLIAGPDPAAVGAFKAAISEAFSMKDLGQLSFLLGIMVARDRGARTLVATQASYIQTVLERFGMGECRPVGAPAEVESGGAAGGAAGCAADGEGEQAAVDRHEYMSLVGSLLYAAMVTRPDIGFAVQKLSRKLQEPGLAEWVAGKRVLRYLAGTRSLGLVFGGGTGGAELVGYSDSDWGGDLATRRSTSAFVFMVGGAAVSWASKLQKTVAKSSCEAEYMALCSAVAEAIYLQRLLAELGAGVAGSVTIYVDNQGAIQLAHNPAHHKLTKHIDIKYHFIRERVGSGDVRLQWVPTAEQLADLLTKALPVVRVRELRKIVMGSGSAGAP
jgi:hypothetical protein